MMFRNILNSIWNTVQQSFIQKNYFVSLVNLKQQMLQTQTTDSTGYFLWANDHEETENKD